MKKFLFVLSLFFLIPFSVSAKDVREYTFSEELTDFDFSLAEDIISYYGTSKKYIIVANNFYLTNDGGKTYIKKDSPNFYVYFLTSDDGLPYIHSVFEQGANVSNGLRISFDSVSYKKCSFYTSSSFDKNVSDCDKMTNSTSSWERLFVLLRTSEDESVYVWAPIKSENFYLIPYYSSFKIPLNSSKSDFDLTLNTSLGSYDIFDKNDSDYIFYRNYLNKTINNKFPNITFEITSKSVDFDTNLIKKVTLTSNIDVINHDKYSYYYSIDSGKNFLEYGGNDKKMNLVLDKNTNIVWKVTNKQTGYMKTYSFTLDGIGEPSEHYILFDNGEYGSIFSTKDDDGFSLGKILDSIFNWYKHLIISAFPILKQLQDISDNFNPVDSSNPVCPSYDGSKWVFKSVSSNTGGIFSSNENRVYCVPSYTVDFSKVVPSLKSQDITIIDFSSFLKIRDIFFLFMTVLLAYLTLRKVISIIQGVFYGF